MEIGSSWRLRACWWDINGISPRLLQIRQARSLLIICPKVLSVVGAPTCMAQRSCGRVSTQRRRRRSTTIGRWTTWYDQPTQVALLDPVVTRSEAHWYVHLIQRHVNQPIDISLQLPFDDNEQRVVEVLWFEHATRTEQPMFSRTDALVGPQLRMTVPPRSLTVLAIPPRCSERRLMATAEPSFVLPNPQPTIFPALLRGGSSIVRETHLSVASVMDTHCKVKSVTYRSSVAMMS